MAPIAVFPSPSQPWINQLFENMKLTCSDKYIKSKMPDDAQTRDEIEEIGNDEPVEEAVRN